jgi:hypothetical protein
MNKLSDLNFQVLTVHHKLLSLAQLRLRYLWLWPDSYISPSLETYSDAEFHPERYPSVNPTVILQSPFKRLGNVRLDLQIVLN